MVLVRCLDVNRNQSFHMNRKLSIVVFSVFMLLANFSYSLHLSDLNEIMELDSVSRYELFVQLAIKGDKHKMDSLIQLGINADSALFEGITPLMYASEEGCLDVIQLLIENGANVNAVPNNKITALLSALYTGKSEAAKLLLKNNAEVNVQDNSGMSPLLVAIQNNDTVLIDLLLHANADIYHENTEGASALHFAAASGNLEIAEFLLNNGLDINRTDKLGFTPLMISEEFNQNEMGFFLISNNADLNSINSEGLSALSLAILNNNNYFTEMLLMNGAESNPLSKKAKDHWFYAKENGNKEIRELLKKYKAKRNKYPIFNQPYIGITFYGTLDDLMAGLTFGLHEAKYNFSAQLSCFINPFVRSSLFSKDDLTYQFWKRELRIQSKLEKRFCLQRFNSGSYGISFGGTPAYSFGYFRGTGIKPNTGFSIAPSVGTYYRARDFELRLGYERRLSAQENKGLSELYLSFVFVIN